MIIEMVSIPVYDKTFKQTGHPLRRKPPDRVRLLELLETLGNTDQRVLKACRDLITALFYYRRSRC